MISVSISTNLKHKGAFLTHFLLPNPKLTLLLYVSKKEQTHFAKFSTSKEQIVGYCARIEKIYVSAGNIFSCKAIVTHTRNHTDWHNSAGVVQLYFNEKTDYKPQKGDHLLVYGTPTAYLINNQKNLTNSCSLLDCPLYRHALKGVDKDFMVFTPQNTSNWSEKIGQWCSKTLQAQIKEPEAVGMVEALLFGQKDHLSDALHQAYADTGTIHVLAVSELHVGMLLWLIKGLLKCLFRNMGFTFLVELFTLIVLWAYAWLCNFAPPILRATIMITITKAGLILRRSSNTYNALFASAFFCCCGIRFYYSIGGSSFPIWLRWESFIYTLV